MIAARATPQSAARGAFVSRFVNVVAGRRVAVPSARRRGSSPCGNRRLLGLVMLLVFTAVSMPAVAAPSAERSAGESAPQPVEPQPATAESARADQPALVVLVPATVSSIPVLMVAERFPDEYRVELFSDHPQALARLLNGEADLLATGFSVGYARFLAAGDIVHLATPVWGVSALMTHRPIDDLAALAGGEIYAPFEGSPIDVYVRARLAQAGLTDAVHVVYAPFQQAAALVGQGRAAAAVLVEPIASRLEQAGTAYRFENLHDGWALIAAGERRSPQVSVFAARRAYAGGSAFAALPERLRGALADLNADLAAAAGRFAGVLETPVALVESALRNTLFDMPGAAEAQTLIQDYARLMNLPPVDARFFAP